MTVISNCSINLFFFPSGSKTECVQELGSSKHRHDEDASPLNQVDDFDWDENIYDAAEGKGIYLFQGTSRI